MDPLTASRVPALRLVDPPLQVLPRARGVQLRADRRRRVRLAHLLNAQQLKHQLRRQFRDALERLRQRLDVLRKALVRAEIMLK
jgi:hypothetical protein